MNSRKVITISISPEMHDRIEKFAKKIGMTKSSFARQLVVEFMENFDVDDESLMLSNLLKKTAEANMLFAKAIEEKSLIKKEK